MNLPQNRRKKYFKDEFEEGDTKANKGEWKPLKVDKSNIPTGSSKPKVATDDKIKKAKALMLKMKMAKARMN
ncbi:MAG: hypothetical protein MJ197_03510 [Bacteroidales bacterium]|nr:hypothetical protein [Bacteroidales bacterium]